MQFQVLYSTLENIIRKKLCSFFLYGNTISQFQSNDSAVHRQAIDKVLHGSMADPVSLEDYEAELAAAEEAKVQDPNSGTDAQ